MPQTNNNEPSGGLIITKERVKIQKFRGDVSKTKTKKNTLNELVGKTSTSCVPDPKEP